MDLTPPGNRYTLAVVLEASDFSSSTLKANDRLMEDEMFEHAKTTVEVSTAIEQMIPPELLASLQDPLDGGCSPATEDENGKDF